MKAPKEAWVHVFKIVEERTNANNFQLRGEVEDDKKIIEFI